MSRSEHIPALTGIRFFAAISVVLYHYWDTFIPPGIGSPFQSGFMGVSLFFVLSGFVMALSYVPEADRGLDKSRFYVARFARIYPAYVVSLALQVPLLARHIAGGTRIVRETLIAIGSLVANLLLVQAWWRRLDWRWNAPSWSLCAEAFFYLLFPYVAMRLRARRIGCRALFIAMLGCWILMIVPCVLVLKHGVGWNEQPRPEIFQLIAFAPICRLPEFMIGVCLALVYRRMKSDYRVEEVAKRFGGVALYSGCLLCAAVLVAGDRIPFLLRYSGAADLGFAAVIFGLAVSSGPIVKLLSAQVVVLLGEASYAIYILQVPIMDYFSTVVHRPGSAGAAAGAMWLVSYCGLLVLASIVCFKWVETPLRRLINSRAARGRWRADQSCMEKLGAQGERAGQY